MTAPIPPAELEPWLARDDLTLDELVAASAELLAHIAPIQSRYRVRARPDVRTIRYYTSQGLLPRPLGYEGGRARYGSPHLLRLLLIKQMQAEHLTLARIRSVLADESDSSILGRLTAGAAPVAGPRPTDQPGASCGEQLQLRSIQQLSIEGHGRLLARLEIPAEILSDASLLGSLAEELVRIAGQLSPTPSPTLSPTPSPTPRHDEEAL
ncbi:MAG TPA: MerR family transcriptional regulator [Deltaproteobacteria bacterium]|nr:MerR family transcriptional regulator [Deltaproteobacteria bacterium]